MAEWRITILLLFIQGTIGQRPSTPTNVVLELEFINGVPNITGRWSAPLSIANISAIDRYLLVVTVNGTSSFNTTVAVNTTSVNTFETFPNISQRRYTTYSLRVAYISSIGQSDLTDPVSIVSNLLQSASVTAGARKIIASCNIANSKPKALCTAVISNNTDLHAYTFQDGENHVMLDYAPGEYNITIRVHVDVGSSFAITEDYFSFSVSVPSIAPSFLSALVLSSTIPSLSSPTVQLSLPSWSSTSSASSSPSSSSSSSSSSLSISSSSLTKIATTTTTILSLSPTPITPSKGIDDDDKGSSENSMGLVLITVIACTLVLCLTVIFTMIVLICWKHHNKRTKASSDGTTIKVSKKSGIHPTIDIKSDNNPFYDHLDTIKDVLKTTDINIHPTETANTEAAISPLYDHLDAIKDEYCSLAVRNTELRTNSPVNSNHSSYIEMHHDDNDLVDVNTALQSNPSYSIVTSQTHEH